MTLRVCLVLSFLVGACGCQPEFALPDDTIAITAPPAYRVWWEASRACIDKPEYRRFEDVRWFVTAGDLEGADGEDAAALTIGGRVVLRALYRDVPWIIQHEMAHAINLLPANPHPDDPFVTCNLMAWH